MIERPVATPLRPPQLSLWDTVSIIVGIIVGAGIFSAPAVVFNSVPGPWSALGVWALGGLLSFIGALCYAELASTYPRSGGEYVYLTRAYGSGVGFLFAWAQLAVIRTGGGIAAVAFIFGDNAAALFYPDEAPRAARSAVYAAAAILALSAINILGANPGKHTQNLFTIAKVLGIGFVVLAGFLAAAPQTSPMPILRAPEASFAGAMIFVLFTYDGWNEASYVCDEVRNWRRNLPLALILGTLGVTLIYLLFNAACLVGLGFDGVREVSAAPLHTRVASLVLGSYGARAVLVLAMVVTLGAVNGTIFTSSRLYAAMGREHRLFAPLGWWNVMLQTPVCSLLIQAAISIAMVVGVVMIWQKPSGSDTAPNQSGFDTVLDYTAPVFWLFFLLTGLALFVLRVVDRDIDRPFRVPLYPVLPLIFCGWCAYMLCGSILYLKTKATYTGVAVLLAVVLAGIPLYYLSRRLERPKPLPVSADSSPALIASDERLISSSGG